LALEAFGRGALRFDVRFTGEEGIGAGPTQEFFHEFSRRFGDRTDMWRSGMAPSGLFPSPVGDPRMFRILGMLCGKVMLMDMLISLPIAPAFFRRVRGETVRLVDVDPVLAKALAAPEGLIGLPFTCPGIPQQELKDGGGAIDVTAENLQEFARLEEGMTVEVS
jgi:hypothetical protein